MTTYITPSGTTVPSMPNQWYDGHTTYMRPLRPADWADWWTRIGGQIVVTEDASPVRPAEFSVHKLTLRRAFREAGWEDELDALISSSETNKSDWADASMLLSTDPILAPYIPTFAAAHGKTEDEMLDWLYVVAQEGA